MPSLRLFAVWRDNTKKLVEIQGEAAYFSSKQNAKDERDRAQDDTGAEHSVILGPDHWRYNSVLVT